MHDPETSRRAAAADVLYSNGVLDLSALSEWIEGREAEHEARCREAANLSEENTRLAARLAEAEPLEAAGRQRLTALRREAERGLRALVAGGTDGEATRLSAELAETRDPEALERIGRRVGQLLSEAYPVRPTALASGAPASHPEDLHAYRISPRDRGGRETSHNERTHTHDENG